MNNQEDFVRNYAAKRAAQMERAKALRDAREQQARSREPQQTSPSYAGGAPQGGFPPHQQHHVPQQQQQQQHVPQQFHERVQPPLPQASQAFQKPTHVPGHTTSNVRQTTLQPAQPVYAGAAGPTAEAVSVTEGDFRRAVALGVITPEQSQQLWTVISAGGNAPPRTASMEQPTYQPSAYAPQADPPSRSTKVAGKSRKPEWNSDAEPRHEDSYDDYGTAPPPRQAPQHTPQRAKQPQIQHREWNAEATETPEGFGAPPPVPGRRRPQAASDKPAPPRSAPQHDFDSQPAGAQSRSSTAGADRWDTQREEPERPRANLAPSAASRARRSNTRQEAPPPPPPPPVEAHHDEVEEFMRQKAEAAARLEEELNDAGDEPLVDCHQCGRRFRQSIINKHAKVCKTVNKKRRAFDTKAQRLDIEGAEVLQTAVRQPKRQPEKQAAPGKVPKWKAQHEQLQAAMAAVRHQRAAETTGGVAMPPPPPVPSAPDDRVPCPHCNRKFAEDVAERHIPKCKTTINRPRAVGARR